MSKFKDPCVQKAYLRAKDNHKDMIRVGAGGQANAYRRGYEFPESEWPREWKSYPFFAAGRDRGRKERKRGASLGRKHYRNGTWRGSLVARFCHADIAAAYEKGYDAAFLQAALRYPGTSSGYMGGRF